jgi:hypothetical protein
MNSEHQDAHRTGTHQLQQATHRTRQIGGNTGKNQDRYAVAQTTLGDLLAQPHQEHRSRRQRADRRHSEPHARGNHQAGRSFQRHRNAKRLEQGQTQGAVTRVLRDLATAGFAFFLELLEGRHHVGQQLHDDRRRDVRHDPQREDRETGQGTTRHQVGHAQNAAFLTLEELLQLGRVNPRHRNMRADPIHDQGEQQKHQAATQVAELAGFRQLSRVGCHVYYLC